MEKESLNISPIIRVINSLNHGQEAPMNIEQSLSILDAAKALLQYREAMKSEQLFIQKLEAIARQV
ncbi:MAG: hypothetical protein MI862_26520 [Desulfobacterales bacterium]|nr:hypothetical protein [Desulfobacterales bacterium]